MAKSWNVLYFDDGNGITIQRNPCFICNVTCLKILKVKISRFRVNLTNRCVRWDDTISPAILLLLLLLLSAYKAHFHKWPMCCTEYI